MNFYNEIDEYAAAWLRNLIAAGHIAPGVVDTRSIEDIEPHELRRYTQCHFFAGIGVWSRALRLAGWGDDRPVWTGSCPCQPFSAAGKGAGFADERHLWPAWHHLIRECRPAVVFGEQVASKDVDPWIDLVQADMEALGYAVGAVPFPSAGVGAPHIRDRCYFVADAERADVRGKGSRTSTAAAGRMQGADGKRQRVRPDVGAGGTPLAGALADDDGARQRSHAGAELHDAEHHVEPRRELGDTERDGLRVSGRSATDEPHESSDRVFVLADDAEQGRGAQSERTDRADGGSTTESRRLRHAGFWSACDWLPCRDGKVRPVEPGTFPLVNGAPARVGRLRAYGNAIVAPAAAAFIGAYLDGELA